MGEVAKCTSWLGHKFEARFSRELPTTMTRLKMDYSSDIELLKNVIYERDICIRCGATVEKNATPAAENQAQSTT